GRDEDVASRLAAYLEGQAAGMHRLGPPAVLLDSALPGALARVYRQLDGGELFHETIVLLPSARLGREGESAEGRRHVGEIAGDELFVDESGRVWRLEEDTGEWLAEGS